MRLRNSAFAALLTLGLVLALAASLPGEGRPDGSGPSIQDDRQQVSQLTVAAVSSGAAVQQLPEGPPGPQEQLDELGISGYADPLSVQPGERVDVMVSTTHEAFDATLVRVVHGDADPLGPGIKEEVIASPSNGQHPGTRQTLSLGSYVTVDDAPALRPAQGFTITAWIAPTTIPGSELNPLASVATPAGTPRPQGIVTKWSEQDETGYGLVIEDDGSLGLWLAGSDGSVERVSTGVPMRPWTPAFPSVEAGGDDGSPMMANESGWYFVAATFDPRRGEVSLYQEPITDLSESTRSRVSELTRIQDLAHTRSPLLMAAYWDGAEGGDGQEVDDQVVGGLFNGKIDNPRLYGRALTRGQIERIQSGRDRIVDDRPCRGRTCERRQEDRANRDGAVAAWDFSQRMHSDAVVDVARAGGRNDGTTVNFPVRAVTGHNWTAEEMDFKHAPEQYGAMYFKQDMIGDSRWEPSVSFDIPADARSGFYAAKLQAGDDEYYVPFFVRPRSGTSRSRIAYLIPTFTYLAYGDTGSWGSIYDAHSDGSGVVYSTHLRPLTDQRVKTTGPNGEGTPWGYEADTHLTDWLESTGYEVDYITDHDLHAEGAELLEPYAAVLTGTHPEYHSAQILDAFQSWLSDGGRLMYLGGNGFYWITSLAESGDHIELRRHDGSEAWQAPPGEYYHSTTGEFGGLWRFRGRHPQELVGVGFTAQGFSSAAGDGDYGVPYERAEDSTTPAGSWVFEGVEEGPIGDFPTLELPGGPAGQEVDRAEYALGTPADTLVLAQATGFGDEYLHVVEELPWSNLMQGGSINPLVRADMTLMHYPNGGAVFSASSMTWTGSLFYDDYQNQVSQITRNVLDRFASGDPLPGAPGG